MALLWQIGKYLSKHLLTFLLFFASAAVTGIVGNRSDYTLSIIFGNKNLNKIISFKLWLVILTLIIVCSLFLYLFVMSRSLHRKLHIFNKINNSVMGYLLRSFSNERSFYTIDADNDFLDCLQSLSAQAINLFSFFLDNPNVMIFHPDPQNSDYLTMTYTTYETDRENREFLQRYPRPYIGPSKPEIQKRGLAGQAFVTGEIQQAHLSMKSGMPYATHQHYIFPTNSLSQKQNCHTSVAIPIQDYRGQVLGVICLDTTSSRIFNLQMVQSLLHYFTQRLALVTLAYQQGKQMPV